MEKENLIVIGALGALGFFLYSMDRKKIGIQSNNDKNIDIKESSEKEVVKDDIIIKDDKSYEITVQKVYSDFVSYKKMLGGYDLRRALLKDIYKNVDERKIRDEKAFFEKLTFGDFDTLVIPPYDVNISDAMSNFRALQKPSEMVDGKIKEKDFNRIMDNTYGKAGNTQDLIGFNIVSKNAASYRQIADKLDRSSLGYKPEVGFDELKKVWDKITYNVEQVSSDIKKRIIIQSNKR